MPFLLIRQGPFTPLSLQFLAPLLIPQSIIRTMINVLNMYTLVSDKMAYTNSVDPDQTAPE